MARDAPVNVKQEVVVLHRFGAVEIDGEWREGAWILLSSGEQHFVSSLWLEHMIEVA